MTSADEEIEEKLNKIFTQLPTCPDTCDLDDTYLNKLLDYLDSRDFDPIKSGLVEFVEVIKELSNAPLDLVSFSVRLICVKSVINQLPICLRVAKFVAETLKRFSVSTVPVLECSLYQTGVKVIKMSNFSLIEDILSILDISELSLQTLAKPDGSIFAQRNAFDFQLAYLNMHRQISESKISQLLIKLLHVVNVTKDLCIRISHLNLLTDFWTIDDCHWVEFKEIFAETIRNLLEPSLLHTMAGENQNSVLKAYGVLVVRSRCETVPKYKTLFQQLNSALRIKLASDVLCLKNADWEYPLDEMAAYSLKELLIPVNDAGVQIKEKELNLSLGAFCDKMLVFSYEETLVIAKSLRSFSFSYDQCQMKVKSHFWRASTTIFQRLECNTRGSSDDEVKSVLIDAARFAFPIVMSPDVTLKEKLMAGAFLTSVMQWPPSPVFSDSDQFITKVLELTKSRNADWELRDLCVQLLKFVVQIKVSANMSLEPPDPDSERFKLWELLLQQLSDEHEYVVTSAVTAVEEIIQMKWEVMSEREKESVLIGILNVLKSEKEHPEPRRAVVKFWRSVCSNTFIEFNRILDQIIRLVEIALNDYDWEVKEELLKLLDCCFTNNYRECHRDTVYSTVVTCLLQLIDDADVSLLALQLAEKLRSEVCTKIDSSIPNKQSLLAIDLREKTIADLLKLFQLISVKLDDFHTGEIIAHVNDADAILGDILAALHRSRLELDCY